MINLSEKNGKFFGVVFGYFLFTSILIVILKFAKNIQKESYPWIALITLAVFVVGTIIQKVFK